LELALKRIGYAIFSISVLISFGFTSNQAFAGFSTVPTSCADCEQLEQDFSDFCSNNANPGSNFISPECEDLARAIETCRPTFCRAVGGDMIPLDATAVLIAGIQTNALSVLSAFVVIGAIAFGALVISVKRKN